MAEILNLNELVLDRVRSLRLLNLEDGSVLARLTKLEDPSLQTSAESEDVTDAIGGLITQLFRAKTGSFSATNSLFSADLYAQQLGSEKEVATAEAPITASAEQILTVKDGKVTLAHTPSNTIKFIYGFEKGGLSKKYAKGVSESDTEFAIDGKEITVPTGVTGQIYVEYEYSAKKAIRIVNDNEKFPSTVGVKIEAIFRDQCNDNIVYAGTIVARKGKLDPSQVEIALTATGKHPFTINFFKDYCDEEGDLFSIIIAGEEDEE